jgi:hypothetical protein
VAAKLAIKVEVLTDLLEMFSECGAVKFLWRSSHKLVCGVEIYRFEISVKHPQWFVKLAFRQMSIDGILGMSHDRGVGIRCTCGVDVEGGLKFGFA